MAVSPMKMFEVPEDDQAENKENIVLRSLVGDPNRHTPLADHRSPSTFSPLQKQAAAMYTLETRYQPIPAKVLPKTTDPRVYYIDSRRTEAPPITNERALDREMPLPIEPEPESMVPTAFLEPKVISQPIFYSIVDTKTRPIVKEQPLPINRESTHPAIYSITDRPRRPTIDMTVNNSDIPVQVANQSPTIYTVVGSPRLSDSTVEQSNQSPPNPSSIAGGSHPHSPIKESAKQNLQPVANLYSLIGSPARTSRGVQVNSSDHNQPAPILYTIVGDTPIHTDRSHEKPLTTIRKSPTEAAMYTLGNGIVSPKAPQHQPITKPSLYALVGKVDSPFHEDRARAPASKKTPSPPITTTRPRNRSFERKSETINNEMITYSVIKAKQQPITKEHKLPKSEAIFIPLNEERRTRPLPPSQTNPKPYIIAQSQPVSLPDYRSPYAERTHKAYRERKYNNDPIPISSRNHTERKPRPALYEPRYRAEKHHPYQPTKPTSLERYPVDTKPRSSLWDHGYQTQTDDDEEYEQKLNRKKRSFRTGRSRAPWIPVW